MSIYFLYSRQQHEENSGEGRHPVHVIVLEGADKKLKLIPYTTQIESGGQMPGRKVSTGSSGEVFRPYADVIKLHRIGGAELDMPTIFKLQNRSLINDDGVTDLGRKYAEQKGIDPTEEAILESALKPYQKHIVEKAKELAEKAAKAEAIEKEEKPSSNIKGDKPGDLKL